MKPKYFFLFLFVICIVSASNAQVSGVGYIFTYEMNWFRGLSSDDSSRLYPTHFTYNFLNSGDPESGSTILDG